MIISIIKKTIFTILAITLVVCGCNKTKQFKVSLNLRNADHKTVYLYKFTSESVYSRKVKEYLNTTSEQVVDK